MNRRRFLKTVTGAAVIVAAPAPLLTLVEPELYWVSPFGRGPVLRYELDAAYERRFRHPKELIKQAERIYA
jgi:hypothetical protein